MACEVMGLKEDKELIVHHSFVKSDVKLKLSKYYDSQHYMTFKPSDKLQFVTFGKQHVLTTKATSKDMSSILEDESTDSLLYSNGEILNQGEEQIVPTLGSYSLPLA